MDDAFYCPSVRIQNFYVARFMSMYVKKGHCNVIMEKCLSRAEQEVFLFCAFNKKKRTVLVNLIATVFFDVLASFRNVNWMFY